MAEAPQAAIAKVSRMHGTWRITAMELWDLRDVDLMGPGYIELRKDGIGSFRFIAVEGWIDYRESLRDGRPMVEFSWEGHDESDAALGRGWASLQEDGALHGRIFIHLGDDSGFAAVRSKPGELR